MVSLNLSVKLTMDITLSLVCLCHEEIGHMSSDVILIADSVASKNLLKSVTISAQSSILTYEL